ncbi:copper chaperone PCu(A)C [Modestobacter roseus]|uniref:Copper(I)-binding protein n=1 Tax=Modestobacter roseus TaxID=1181884 RepID=A0A562IXQ7_9ACTN|nr:copper chaperone PCu(A)C [Modestobacter roseus]TWH75620.1 copper(I)-binding protein [Modestobacter roseus]
MNRRAPRAAALGALLLSPVALSACSAGQVSQTANSEQQLGVNADAEGVVLRGLQLPYPTGGEYPAGSDARLIGAIVNETQTDDTLVSVTGPDFTDVEVVDPAAEPAADGSTGGTGSSLDLTVPAGEALLLGGGDGPAVTLVGLSSSVGVSQYVPVTFTFEEAGEVTLDVPVGNPVRDLPRGEQFDFHEEEGGEEGGETGSEPTEPGSESSESADE